MKTEITPSDNGNFRVQTKSAFTPQKFQEGKANGVDENVANPSVQVRKRLLHTLFPALQYAVTQFKNSNL